jgi:hypothetical protein
MSAPTKAQALKAYRAVCAALGESPVNTVFEQDGTRWPNGPVLVKDFQMWGSPTAWAVVWESGTYDWPQGLTGGYDEADWLMMEHGRTPAARPPLELHGLFLEPINGWAVAIARG